MHIATMLDIEQAADPTTIAIRKIESALAEFDAIKAGLAELSARYPADVVYDVSTTKGMSEAIAHRAAWRDPRILVEKYRKLAKAPVLTLGKDIDARAVWITEQLLVGETPADEQIKVEERRKDDEKQARINAEFGRVQAIHEAIAEIHMRAMAVSTKSSGIIAAELEMMRVVGFDPLAFQELIEQAKQAHASAIAKLEVAFKAKLYSEGEATKLAAERAELNELRAQQAAQKAKDDAAAAQARAAEDARLIEQRRAMDEQQRRLDAQAAALNQRLTAAVAPTVPAPAVSVWYDEPKPLVSPFPVAVETEQAAPASVAPEYPPHLVRAMHSILRDWQHYEGHHIHFPPRLRGVVAARDAVLAAIGFEPLQPMGATA